MKIISWNVNGIRAAVKKDFVSKFRELDSDIFCLQETKAQDDQVKEALSELSEYHIYCNSAQKKGYSGVTIISKEIPTTITGDIDVKAHDTEGRVIAAEYDKFILVNVYVPNSGNGLVRLDYRSTWDKAFARYLKKRMKEKPIIVTGDLNVAHQAIDLARPKQNYNKTSGYTQVEIDGMDRLLKTGIVDTFRYSYPEEGKYTFWSVRFGARAKNVGCRIAYFLVDKRLLPNVVDTRILDQVMGSDHCPIELELSL